MTDATRDLLRPIAIVAALALLAWLLVMNPMPWSPMGEAQEQQRREGEPSMNTGDFEFPDGWGPVEGARIVTPRAPAAQT